jgi:hypothetical protein
MTAADVMAGRQVIPAKQSTAIRLAPKHKKLFILVFL